ncbi:MAG TPA: tetratricopeptide repeat protein, partial [Chthoniobacterales bacterium]|nr:tetratricopeptide repeat protein [Chthoniobacterales bacterium]
LGALLYEMLTGEKPHKFSTPHPSREEICQVVREQEAALPSASVSDSAIARRLRGDLDAIVLKALRKDPRLRYQSVADFAADLRRHLQRQPVLARGPGTAYRAKVFVSRHGWIQPVALAAGIILLAASAYFVVQNRSARIASESAALPDDGKSIAVLPFDNFGSENPSYFADGVQDNILTGLGKVSDLKVVSRNAVAPYRDKQINSKEIGRELSVAHVLLGSVQKSGDRIRINAQLVDTRTNTQVWTEQYDRKVEDIFALQSELAETIVAQLRARLTSPEKAAIAKRPTENLEAYEEYLRARATMNRAAPGDSSESWNEAVALLHRAISRDPKFALAYCVLNEAQVYLYRFGPDPSPSYLAAAKQAAERALQLQPDLEEARLAMARYYYHGLHDYRQTMEQLSLVPASTAHGAEYYTLAGLAQRRLGRWSDAMRDSEKALELDPRNPHAAGNLMQTYTGLRRYAQARRVADATIRQLPPAAADRLWILKAEAEIAAGDLDAGWLALENVSVRDAVEYQVARVWLSVLQRDSASAERVLAGANEDAEASASFWIVVGMLRQLQGNGDEARQCFLAARNLTESALLRRPDEPDLFSQLAEADLGLGQTEEALREAQRAVELAPPQVDALTAPYCATRLAQVLV